MAFAIGINLEEFKHLNPKKLGYCLEGYKIQQKMRDEELWRAGLYNYSAFSTVLHNAFSKGKKAEYIKKPILQDMEEKKEIPEEKRIEMENQKLAMSLRIMQANFEINKKMKEKENS